jgi:hypothetical protein
VDALMSVHSESVVVHHVTGQGVTGPDGVDVTPTVDITLTQVTMQPATVRATVIGNDEEPSQGRWLLSTAEPHDEDEIAKGDTLTWRGHIYNVDTIPHTYWQELPHTEVTVTRTGG